MKDRETPIGRRKKALKSVLAGLVAATRDLKGPAEWMFREDQDYSGDDAAGSSSREG